METLSFTQSNMLKSKRIPDAFQRPTCRKGWRSLEAYISNFTISTTKTIFLICFPGHNEEETVDINCLKSLLKWILQECFYKLKWT